MTIKEARTYGSNILSSVEGKKKSLTPSLDTDVLLEHLLSCDKTHLLFHGEKELSKEEEASFKEALNKRCTGLPVAYITGHKEFFGYDFLVNPSTLIPKPDTELLVELAIKEIENRAALIPMPPITICDMCTGTGCVGLSIIRYCADEEIVSPQFIPSLTLCDLSQEALNLARENARILLKPIKTASYSFIRTNLFEETCGKFDIIVSNPPYVPAKETMELLQDGRAEPILALNGDVENDGSLSSTRDGLSLMRRLIPQAYQHLNTGGMLFVESGEYNAKETAELFLQNGFTQVKTFNDLSNQPRVTCGIKEKTDDTGFDNPSSM